MKKFNLHEIMKNAWHEFKICKSLDGSIINGAVYHCAKTFAECLRKAWAEAKKAVKAAAALAERVAFHKGMTIDVNGEELELNRWTNYGKDRLYVGGNCGYYDIKSGKFFWNKFYTSSLNTDYAEKLICNIDF